jgi:hypothetical protein
MRSPKARVSSIASFTEKKKKKKKEKRRAKANALAEDKGSTRS